jgi:hypothetical protein
LIANSFHHVKNVVVLAALSMAVSGAGQTSAPSRTAERMPTIGPAAQVNPPAAGYRFPNGQTYVYSVEWHMFTAGMARVTMDASGTQQRVTATADSLGVVNLMYVVHDHFDSYFDPKSFCSQKIVKHSEEGKRRRDTEVQFEYTRHKALRSDKDLRTGQNTRTENDIPDCVTDVVTGFYYLASQPLTAGSTYTFPVNDGSKTIAVAAHVDTSEHVKVPAGDYSTLRISAEPISGTLKGKAKISVWFTDDANHIPVQMRSKLAWGTLLFRLQRIDKPTTHAK